MSKKMSKYITDIVNTMNKVQGGKLNAKVGIHRDEKNEISQIATHFNIMMNTVNEQMQMVKESGIREKERKSGRWKPRLTRISSTIPWIPLTAGH